MNNKYKIEFITDTFIGDENFKMPFEYKISKNKENKKIISYYDVFKFLDKLYEINKKKYDVFVSKIINYFKNKKKIDREFQKQSLKNSRYSFIRIYDEVKDVFEREGYSRKDFVKVSRYFYGNENKFSNVKTFINDNSRFYIPGSSLKGVLRTALMNELVKKNSSRIRWSNRKELETIFKELEDSVEKIINYEDEKVIFRDVYLKRKRDLVIVSEIKNFMSSNSGLLLYEVVRGEFEEAIRNYAFFRIINFREEWFKVINEYSLSVINNLLKFIDYEIGKLEGDLYKNKKKEGYEKVKNNFLRIKDMILNLEENSCIFPIGEHTNWISKSVPFLYEDMSIEEIKKFRLVFEKERIRGYYKFDVNRKGKKGFIRRYDIGTKSLSYSRSYMPLGWVKLFLAENE